MFPAAAERFAEANGLRAPLRSDECLGPGVVVGTIVCSSRLDDVERSGVLQPV
jgi:hypothetical protein